MSNTEAPYGVKPRRVARDISEVALKWRGLRRNLIDEWMFAGYGNEETAYNSIPGRGHAQWQSSELSWRQGVYGPEVHRGNDATTNMMPVDGTFTPPYQFSCEFIAYCDGAGADNDRIMGIDDPFEIRRYDTSSGAVSNQLFQAGTTTTYSASTPWASAGVYSHVICTGDYPNGYGGIYVNGVYDVDTPVACDDAPTPGTLSLFGRTGSIPTWYGGIVYMRFYDTVISAAEAAALYADPFGISRAERTLHFPPQYRHVVPGRR